MQPTIPWYTHSCGSAVSTGKVNVCKMTGPKGWLAAAAAHTHTHTRAKARTSPNRTAESALPTRGAWAPSQPTPPASPLTCVGVCRQTGSPQSRPTAHPAQPQAQTSIARRAPRHSPRPLRSERKPKRRSASATRLPCPLRHRAARARHLVAPRAHPLSRWRPERAAPRPLVMQGERRRTRPSCWTWCLARTSSPPSTRAS